MITWKNKVVWITGASSGIGEALAIALADKGAHLILSSRNQITLEALRSRLKHAHVHRVLPMDVSNAKSLDQSILLHHDLIETVDVVFANAGISQRALAWEASSESERLLMETNFFGAVTVAKAALKGMRKRKQGHIAVMSSVTGKFGFPLRSSYAASKHALHGYFESMRTELYGSGIGVTLICPGRIRTNISLNALQADGKPHAKMDDGQAAGVDVDRCAKIILRAVEQNRAEVYIGKERFLVYVHRFFPGLFRWIVKQIKPT